jgi:RNA polymerase sigma factor (sigma-70 family)
MSDRKATESRETTGTPEQELEAQYPALSRMLQLYFRHKGVQDPANLSQETILRAFRNVKDGTRTIYTTLRGYLFGIAFNVYREERKKRTDYSSDTLDVAHLEAAVPDPDRAIFLDQCLAHLSQAERELLYNYHTQKPEELALSLGISVEVLRVRYHRALEKVRDRMKSEDKR